MDEEIALLQRLARQALARATAPDGSLSVSALLALDAALARRALRCWLEDSANSRADRRPGRLEQVHLASILRWLHRGQSGTHLDLPDSRRVRRDFDALRLDTTAANGAPPLAPCDYRVHVRSLPAGTPPPTSDGEEFGAGDLNDERTWRLICPRDGLRGNLQVRGWRRGDRIALLGLTGTKKLSDLLREKRVSAAQRERVLIVADAEGILWVVGLARAERTRLLPDTSRMVTISISRRTTPTKQGTDTR